MVMSLHDTLQHKHCLWHRPNYDLLVTQTKLRPVGNANQITTCWWRKPNYDLLVTQTKLRPVGDTHQITTCWWHKPNYDLPVCHKLTHFQPTLWNRIIEKLIVTELVNIFLYFITVYTKILSFDSIPSQLKPVINVISCLFKINVNIINKLILYLTAVLTYLKPATLSTRHSPSAITPIMKIT
jgi:hypothetical protein